MPGSTVVVGIDLTASAELAETLKKFPQARVVSITNGTSSSGMTVLPKRRGEVWRWLRAQRADTTIILQDFRSAKLVALLMRSHQRFILRQGDLAPLAWSDLVKGEVRRIAKGVYFRLRRLTHRLNRLIVPPPVGAGNDYTFIEQRLRQQKPKPALFVSVIVPVYNRKAILEKTLAGLAQQTYPRDLFEVIVADDGSHDHPEELATRFGARLQLRFVRQEDDGYRLSAVRNLAIAAARGDVIVSLDCDMLPEPGFLQSHAQWFHVYDGPLCVVGGREFVNTDALSAEAITSDFDVVRRLPRTLAPDAVRKRFSGRRDWRKGEMSGSRQLKDHWTPYSMASGGNCSYRKADAVAAGLYYEGFRKWGGEDADFAYRLYRRGAYFVAEAGALAYHQDHPPAVQREADRLETRDILGRRVPYYRSYVRSGAAFEMPKVSVYIPAYNVAPFIERAVRSALAQSERDLEVVVANDGSTDETLSILKRLAETESRVRIVDCSHAGIGATSNAALAACRGEFILQLDGDDELLANAAENLVAAFETSPNVALAFGGYELLDAKNHVTKVVYPAPYDPARHLIGNVVSPPRMFRARDFFRTAGFNTELKNAVDYDMTLKLAEQGQVRVVNKILYRYYMHGANTSIVDRSAQEKNHIRVIEMALARRKLNWKVLPGTGENVRAVTLKKG